MKRVLIAASAVLIAASYAIVFAPLGVGQSLLREDGPIEQATMLFFLGAFLCFLRAWQLRAGDPAPPDAPRERRMFILFLALLMFVCAGEEISWGQRIFGWKTPNSWSEHNAQSETNLHNLAEIEGDVRAAGNHSFWRNLTNANRVFAIFWFTFFVVVPVLDRTLAPARKLFRAVGLPIPPLWIGALFLLNRGLFYAGCQRLFALGPDAMTSLPLDELKEQNDAFVYAVAGVAAWVQAHGLKRACRQAAC